MTSCKGKTLEHLEIYDKNTGKGIDVDYYDFGDGVYRILSVEETDNTAGIKGGKNGRV